MEFLEPKLLSGEKRWTNREDSDFRNKCNIGDVMHIFVKMRTPESRKLFNAVVKNKIKWQIDDAPQDVETAKNTEGPLPGITWYKFAIGDGFNNYDDFLNFFQNHKKKTARFICFSFSRLLTIEDYLNFLS